MVRIYTLLANSSGRPARITLMRWLLIIERSTAHKVEQVGLHHRIKLCMRSDASQHVQIIIYTRTDGWSLLDPGASF